MCPTGIDSHCNSLHFVIQHKKGLAFIFPNNNNWVADLNDPGQPKEMSQQTNSRGRPKGTGIDDRELIGAIANMIETNPDMRPTTAIKALGVSNPSTIRRLRDKFKTRSPRDCASDDDDPVRKPARRAQSEHDDTPTAAYAALAGPKGNVRTSSPVASHKASQCGDRTPIDVSLVSVASSPSAFVAAMSSGLAFGNVIVSQQAQLLRGLEANPFVRAWMNHQVLCSEFFLKSAAVAVAGAGRTRRR